MNLMNCPSIKAPRKTGTLVAALLSCFSTSSALALQDGLSAATAWSSLSYVHYDNRVGYHYFNIDGQTFKTFVDDQRYITVLRFDQQPNNAALPDVTDMEANGPGTNGILPAAIMAKFTNLQSIRLQVTNVADPLIAIDATTSNATLLGRIASRTTLHQGIYDRTINSEWVGSGTANLNRESAIYCTSSYGSQLAYNIIHTCGDMYGTMLIPGANYRRIQFKAKDIAPSDSVSLSVKPAQLTGSLEVARSADKTLNVDAGEIITYTIEIANNSQVRMYNIDISENHQAMGTPPVIDIESAAVNDSMAIDSGDTFDNSSGDSKWDQLGPGDKLTVKATYTVVYQDIEKYQ